MAPPVRVQRLRIAGEARQIMRVVLGRCRCTWPLALADHYDDDEPPHASDCPGPLKDHEKQRLNELKEEWEALSPHNKGPVA